MECRSFERAEPLLEALEKSIPDVLVTDVRMPGMDGLAATRHIRAMAHLRDIPIIAMTADAMKGDRERCLEAGMNDYIAKPIQREHFLAKVAEWGAKAQKTPD